MPVEVALPVSYSRSYNMPVLPLGTSKRRISDISTYTPGSLASRRQIRQSLLERSTSLSTPSSSNGVGSSYSRFTSYQSSTLRSLPSGPGPLDSSGKRLDPVYLENLRRGRFDVMSTTSSSSRSSSLPPSRFLTRRDSVIEISTSLKRDKEILLRSRDTTSPFRSTEFYREGSVKRELDSFQREGSVKRDMESFRRGRSVEPVMYKREESYRMERESSVSRYSNLGSSNLSSTLGRTKRTQSITDLTSGLDNKRVDDSNANSRYLDTLNSSIHDPYGTLPRRSRFRTESVEREERSLSRSRISESPLRSSRVSESPVRTRVNESPSRTRISESPSRARINESPSRTRLSETPSRSFKNDTSLTRNYLNDSSLTRTFISDPSPTRTLKNDTSSARSLKTDNLSTRNLTKDSTTRNLANDTSSRNVTNDHFSSHNLKKDSSLSKTSTADSSSNLNLKSDNLSTRNLKNDASSHNVKNDISSTLKSDSSLARSVKTDSSSTRTLKNDIVPIHVKNDSSLARSSKTDSSSSHTVKSDIVPIHNVKNDSSSTQKLTNDNLSARNLKTDSSATRNLTKDSSTIRPLTNESSSTRSLKNDGSSTWSSKNDSSSTWNSKNDSSSSRNLLNDNSSVRSPKNDNSVTSHINENSSHPRANENTIRSTETEIPSWPRITETPPRPRVNDTTARPPKISESPLRAKIVDAANTKYDINHNPTTVISQTKPLSKPASDYGSLSSSFSSRKDRFSSLSGSSDDGYESKSHRSSLISNGKPEPVTSLSNRNEYNTIKSSNSSKEITGLVGLRNLGNTCFMNSVIQCLSNTQPILDYCLRDSFISDLNTSHSSMKGALTKAFASLLQSLWKDSVGTCVSPHTFKQRIQKFAPRFMGYSQQDAQEFLRCLLQGLHEDVNRVTGKPKPIAGDIDEKLSDSQKATEAWKRYLHMDDSKIVDLFVGQLKSTLKCTSCGHSSVTFDPFWDLSLPIPKSYGTVTLQECLNLFTKEEILDGDEKPTCSRCKKREKCMKSLTIQRFPKMLVIHLKRFSQERYRAKLTTLVDFPVNNLDLSNYAADKRGVQKATYNLYAVANHSGTTYGGHYTAYCKNPKTGEWYDFNDTTVAVVTSISDIIGPEAYLLFYEMLGTNSHL